VPAARSAQTPSGPPRQASPYGHRPDQPGDRQRQIDPALAELNLRQLRDEQGRELVDLPKAPLPSEDVRLPTRFLAKGDAALMSRRPTPDATHHRVEIGDPLDRPEAGRR
jgi:hypothetical protein